MAMANMALANDNNDHAEDQWNIVPSLEYEQMSPLGDQDGHQEPGCQAKSKPGWNRNDPNVGDCDDDDDDGDDGDVDDNNGGLGWQADYDYGQP